MSRTGGEKTRKKILNISEKLFSEKGYDGTSIQEIADAVNINKALIYYHFKNKQDIIDSLFEHTLEEMLSIQSNTQDESRSSDEERIINIIELLQKKRKILSVMLMEALKNDKSGHLSLFQCANAIISRDVGKMVHKIRKCYEDELNRNELLMHEFFTGFVPLVFFALFKDKWADFFKCDSHEIVSIFAKVFKESHIKNQ